MPTHNAREITRELDRLYDLRDDAATTIFTSVRAIERYARRRTLDYDLLWRLSRAHFFLGQCAADTEREEACAHHAAGARAGTLAAQHTNANVEGHFWAGVNLALRAQVERGWHTLPLKLSLALRARIELRRAVRLDAGYHGAGPLRVLARLESKLPAPLGSVKRAVENYERAVTLAPTNTVTRRYFAELLHDVGAQDKALVHLRAICDAPTCVRWKYETERDKRWAVMFVMKH